MEKIAAGTLIWIIMFWNLENFFIPSRDSQSDVQYVPDGEMFWSWNKFRAKCNGIAKSVLLTKEKYGKFPIIIGLCEVENRKALNALIYDTPLSKLNYGIMHKDSKDRRGIDVAMLYDMRECRILRYRDLPIILPSGDTLATRSILYAEIVVKELDTLHVFVNHWPSKFGGERKSLPARMVVSEKLNRLCDSILDKNKNACIVAMGDFNDTYDSPPIQNVSTLLNMTEIMDSAWRQKKVSGSYKYKGRWEGIDHFLISPGLYDGEWIYTGSGAMDILTHSYLLERDLNYGGYKIRRTSVGPRYNGGVSDHLPIILKVYERKFLPL